MNPTLLAGILLAAVSAGGVAYVFLYPILSGSNRVEKRQRALMGTVERRERAATVSRRDQVAQSIKDLEGRQKARNSLTLETRIAQAGLDWSRNRYLTISAILAAVLGVAVFILTDNLILAAAAAFTGGLGLPRWMLRFFKKRRLARFLDDLPNAMDIIVRGIKSGLPLGDCIRIIASESREPVRSEFRFIVEQQSLGIPMADAVAKIYERVPVSESNFFAIVIGIQSKSGGNLSEALGNLSRVLRERKKMKGKIAAMSMEAKASAVIIGALPFVVGILTYISSPTYIELLWTTNVGKLGLIAGAVWMLTGILVMKKMCSFDY